MDDTLTLRALWLAVFDAPLGPALGLLTGAGLALLGLCAVLAAAAWLRFLLTPDGSALGGAPRVRPGGEAASRRAWRAGRLGLGTLVLALGIRAIIQVVAPGPGGPGALGYALAAAALAWARGAWMFWGAVLPLAPIPRLPVASDVHRIAEAIVRWDRESTGGMTTLLPGARGTGPGGGGGSGPPRTHRTPDV